MIPKNTDERAITVRNAVRADPGSVAVEEVVDLLVCGTAETRRIAFDAFRPLVSARPVAVEAAADRLGAHLQEDSSDIRRRVALTAGALVEAYPDIVEPLAPPLRSIANAPTESGREAAVVALSKLAVDRPTAVLPAVDALVSICLDPISVPKATRSEPAGPGVESEAAAALRPERERRDQARLHAIAALTLVAAEEPAAVRSLSPSISTLLDDGNDLIRAGACELFEVLATASPDAVEPFAPDLAELAATDPKHPVPWRAADALVALDADRPKQVGTAVAPFATDLSRFLDSKDADKRRAGIALLADAALVHPESIESMVPALKTLLSDDDAFVRTNAIIALGAIDVDRDRSIIAEVAETDPNEGVRDTAHRVLEQFETPRKGA
ncbi:HEAT repeat domain-containing protein (plasmid) [Haloferacaceae archaeon DSL9]